MTPDRVHPFELIFGELSAERFPLLRDALGVAPSLDTFLMSEPAITLLREMRPEEGLEDGGQEFLALVFAAYRFWAAGSVTLQLDKATTALLCTDDRVIPTAPESARYIQVAPRLIWGALQEDEQHEPLDGWFAIPCGGNLLAVALFGVHPDRPGLSVICVEGECPPFPLPREDAAAPYAPTMSGGELAGLHAVASLGELLRLVWRGSTTERNP